MSSREQRAAERKRRQAEGLLFSSKEIESFRRRGFSDDDIKKMENQRIQTVQGYSDENILSGLKKFKAVAKFFGFTEAAEEAEEAINIGEEASVVGDVIRSEVEQTAGVDLFDHSQDSEHAHRYDHNDSYHLAEQHAPNHPVPHSGSSFTFIPNRPSDRKENFVAVS